MTQSPTSLAEARDWAINARGLWGDSVSPIAIRNLDALIACADAALAALADAAPCAEPPSQYAPDGKDACTANPSQCPQPANGAGE
jgi:hypothetical protein